MKTKQEMDFYPKHSGTAALGKQVRASAATDTLPKGHSREHTHHSAHSETPVLGGRWDALQVSPVRFSDQLRDLPSSKRETRREHEAGSVLIWPRYCPCGPLCSAGLCPPQDGAGRGREPWQVEQSPPLSHTRPSPVRLQTKGALSGKPVWTFSR